MGQPENNPKAVLPVFVKSELLPEGTTVFNLCEATEKVSGPTTIDGATLISGLWRVYPLSEQSRIKILNAPIQIQNKNFRYESFNPFIRRYGGQEVEGTRLIISNLPFSYSNKAVENNLRACGYRLRSQMQFEKARGPDRMLSDWKTGRRFVWVDVPSKTMAKSVKMGDFMAYIYYKEMKKTQECYKCLKVGHRASECVNEEVCLTCRKPGHRRGDPVCGLDLVSADEYIEEESDTDTSDDCDDDKANEEKGEVGDNKENEEKDEKEDETGSEKDDDQEVSSDDGESEKEEGELDDDKEVPEVSENTNSTGDSITATATSDIQRDDDEKAVSNTEVSGGTTNKVTDQNAEAKTNSKRETKVDSTNTVSNTKGRKKGKEKKNTQVIKADQNIDTPKSGLNQSSLCDFGIGTKRPIHEAPSPDELTGSPQKKASRKSNDRNTHVKLDNKK